MKKEVRLDIYEIEDQIRGITDQGLVNFIDYFADVNHSFSSEMEIAAARKEWIEDYEPGEGDVYEAIYEEVGTTDYVRDYYLDGGGDDLLDVIKASIKEELEEGCDEDFEAAPQLLALAYLEKNRIDEISPEAWEEIKARLPKDPKTFGEIYDVCDEVYDRYESEAD